MILTMENRSARRGTYPSVTVDTSHIPTGKTDRIDPRIKSAARIRLNLVTSLPIVVKSE
jgi:hypothetical protein